MTQVISQTETTAEVKLKKILLLFWEEYLQLNLDMLLTIKLFKCTKDLKWMKSRFFKLYTDVLQTLVDVIFC